MSFKWISGLIDRLFAVAGALLFSQFPLFMQQYQQQLLGHVAELQMQVQGMRRAAVLTGKSLHEYVVKFLNSGDIDFKNQGELMDTMIQRYQSLQDGYNALHEASIYAKPWVFIKYFDWDIARSTYRSFEIGLSFSMEGILYAFIGSVCGLMTYWILCKGLNTLFKPFFRQEKTA